MSDYKIGDKAWTYTIKDNGISFDYMEITHMPDEPMDKGSDIYVVEMTGSNERFITTTRWIYKTLDEACERMMANRK